MWYLRKDESKEIKNLERIQGMSLAAGGRPGCQMGNERIGPRRGLLDSLVSAFFYSHLCDLFSESAGVFPLRRHSVIELLEEVAAVLIGHTWLFHRWPIYLFVWRSPETRRTRIARQKHRHKRGWKGGTELCGKVRRERSCSLVHLTSLCW